MCQICPIESNMEDLIINKMDIKDYMASMPGDVGENYI